jgi:hypothetical protein
MPNDSIATDSILAGLNARQESPITTAPFDGPEPSLARHQNGPEDLTSLSALGEAANSLHKKVSSLIALREHEFGEAARKKRAEWNNKSDLSLADRKRLSDIEITEMRKAVVRNSEKELADLSHEAAFMAEQAAAVAPLYDSAVGMLVLGGLNDPRTTAYVTQVAFAGPTQLRLLAREAAAKRNVALGAAILTRLDSMTDSDRTAAATSRQDLANVLVGEQWSAAQAALAACRGRHFEIRAAHKAFRDGKIDGVSSIEAALNRKNEAKFKVKA